MQLLAAQNGWRHIIKLFLFDIICLLLFLAKLYRSLNFIIGKLSSMAKCTVCNSRKGKRKCKATETIVCSLCCGESRTEEKCSGCSFSKSAAATRNYRSVPYYSTQEMADESELESIADVVELSLCQIWLNDHQRVDDRTVGGISYLQFVSQFTGIGPLV